MVDFYKFLLRRNRHHCMPGTALWHHFCVGVVWRGSGIKNDFRWRYYTGYNYYGDNKTKFKQEKINQMNPATQTENYRNQPLAGALYVLIASFVFAILGALVKVVSSSLPNEMVVFFEIFARLSLSCPGTGTADRPAASGPAVFNSTFCAA